MSRLASSPAPRRRGCPRGRPAGQARRRPPTVVLVGGPQVGNTAPDFTLPWANKDGVGPADNPYQLWRDRGKTVVLAFYPQDFTSGCTAEMQTFADQYDTLFGPDVDRRGHQRGQRGHPPALRGEARSALPTPHRP